jgi:hypothetical protein
MEPSPASAGTLDRWAPGTQAIASLLEQRVAAGRWRDWWGCRNWWGWRLRRLLDRDRRRRRSRRSDLCRGRLRRLCRLLRHDGGRNGLGGLFGFESGAAACALFPISLAFLLGAFAGGL